MLVRFSVLQHQYDAHPTVHECEWSELVASMSVYDFRSDKRFGPLVSPAEFFADSSAEPCTCKRCLEQSPTGLCGTIRKRKECVGPVSFLALDFDDVAPESVIAVLNLVDSLALSAFAYSTWKQPQAAQQDPPLARVRLFILISRRVQPEEWPTFYRASALQFGATLADDTASEPTRFFFTPALPIGCEVHAQWWTSEGFRTGTAVPWDVDAVLKDAPPPAEHVITSKGTDPIPRDALVRLATKLEKSDDHQKLRVGQLLRTGLNGHEIALQGDRHVALRDMAWRIAIAFPTGSAVTIAEHFRLSLDFMRAAGTDTDPVVHFCGLIESAQAKVQAQAQEQERQVLSQHARKTAIAWESAGLERTSAYTQAELKEWSSPDNGGPLESRWILQSGSAVWIWFNGDYVGPFMREAIGTACAQWLAPVSSAGVDCFKLSPTGDRIAKSLGELVGQYGRVLKMVEADMSATRTHYDAMRSAVVEAPCPLRPLEPKHDPEVEEWLQLLAGHKFDRLCDWLATCTWLRECAPAVFLMGASGAGKNLFASGVARLWGVAGFTPAEHALGQFNAAVTECPLVYADEHVPENWKGEPRTEDLRALITTNTFKINQKNRPLVTCYGSARVVIGANNFGVISRKADFTPEDAQALADRFILINVGTKEHSPARDFLIQKGGAVWGESVVKGDRLARHALWLRDQVESGVRSFTRGGRMVVPGDASELITALQTGSRVPWNVLSWVWAFLNEPAKHIAASTGRPFAALVHEGRVWLEPTLLVRAWDHYLQGERPPTLEQIERAMRGMLRPEREARLRRGAGGKVKYRALRLEQLETWVSASERDAAELAALLAVDTEALGVPGRPQGTAN